MGEKKKRKDRKDKRFSAAVKIPWENNRFSKVAPREPAKASSSKNGKICPKTGKAGCKCGCGGKKKKK